LFFASWNVTLKFSPARTLPVLSANVSGRVRVERKNVKSFFSLLRLEKRERISFSVNPGCGHTLNSIEGFSFGAAEERVPVGFSLDSKESLNQFLANVERRALRIAWFASRNMDEALDLVQEAMMKFAERYARRPEEEWSVLFYRILQNRITDWHRRNLVRKRLFRWFGQKEAEEAEGDPLDWFADNKVPGPFQKLQQSETGAALEKAIRTLPLRQRQTFLLRAWEGLDIAQTAKVMGCSEGSVKTHYFRALKALRTVLEEFAYE
jgi:RNA polymerase sigma-70 factor, ECF subfamily